MSKLLIFQATTYQCAHSGASYYFHLKGDSISQGNKTEAYEKKMFVDEVVDGEGGDCSQSDCYILIMYPEGRELGCQPV